MRTSEKAALAGALGVWFLERILQLLFIFAIAVFALSSCETEADVIKENWGIELPGGAECLYSEQEEDNWFGEGDRYHVFLLGDGGVDAITGGDIEFSTGRSLEAEEFILEVAENLGVPGKFVPETGEGSEYKFCLLRSPEGDDTCAMIFVDGRLYFAERFT